MICLIDVKTKISEEETAGSRSDTLTWIEQTGCDMLLSSGASPVLLDGFSLLLDQVTPAVVPGLDAKLS